MRLDSGLATAGDHRAHAAWLAGDPAHRRAWDRVESLLGMPLDQLRRAEGVSPGSIEATVRTLSGLPSPRVSARRRWIKGGAAGAVIAASSLLLAQRRVPLTGLTADLHTGTAERSTTRLDDGSELILNARSAVDLRFDAASRRIALRTGAMIIRVAAEQRPLRVDTPHGVIRSLGTRFLVARHPDHTEIAVLEHRVRVEPGQGAPAVIDEGGVARFQQGRVIALPGQAAARAAWADGQLDARSERLGDLVEALRAYTPGWLRVTEAAADLRVFGVFRLDRVDGVLQDLEETYPVTVRRWGPALTVIDRRPAP